MAARTKAVFLDALGTLVELEPPWIGLGRALGEDPASPDLVRAVRAEMDYYRAHSHEGRDEDSLAELRERCARVLSAELGREVSAATLVEAIRFAAYEDARAGLASLREAGIGLVCVSNWDCSLRAVLRRCGLEPMLDGVVSSAEAGARKPEPAIFRVALELAGCEAREALHVGDSAEEDGEGARAAGIRVLLIDRDGGADIASLEEVPSFL
jgi:putative hydrolase of the HAD superfamily